MTHSVMHVHIKKGGGGEPGDDATIFAFALSRIYSATVPSESGWLSMINPWLLWYNYYIILLFMTMYKQLGRGATLPLMQ